MRPKKTFSDSNDLLRALSPARLDPVRPLLEDFEVVGTLMHVALVPRGTHNQTLRRNVHAATVAATLGLSSVDYARRTYSDDSLPAESTTEPADLYIKAYKTAKAYIYAMMDKLTTEGRPDPTNGQFGASLVLERLPSSFFSAHFLYRLGHRYEGHAVARLILEQIAWACAAYSLEDLERIANISTTRSITVLKSLVPEVGQLYGFLSKATHIDYERNPILSRSLTDKILFFLRRANLSNMLALSSFWLICLELSGRLHSKFFFQKSRPFSSWTKKLS